MSNHQIVQQFDTKIDTDAVSIAFLVISLVVYIPIILYLAYPLVVGRHALILQKRHSDLTLWAIYALSIDIVIFSFSHLLFWHAGSNFDRPKPWFSALFCSATILLQFVSQFFATVFNIRLWIIYYDIQYSNLIQSNEWKHIIDQNYNITRCFFVKFRATLGNKKFLKISLWVCCIIITLITSVLAILDILKENSMTKSYMMQFWAFTVVWNIWLQILLSIFMYFKLKKVKYFDDFYVLKEFTAYFKVLVCTAILFIVIIPGIAFIIVQIFPTLKAIERNDTYMILAIYFAFHAYIIFHIAIIYVMTRYIIKKLQADPTLVKQYGESLKKFSYHNVGKKRNIENKENQIEMGQIGMACDLALNPTDSATEISVFHILKKQEYLESFMEHLALEFSQECLLSLIEFVQFRQYAQSHDQQRVSLVASSSAIVGPGGCVVIEDLSTLELAMNISKSSIVFNTKVDDKHKAQQLFEKYILEGSEHEINISARLRGKMNDKFQTASGILRSLSGIGRNIGNVGKNRSINGLPFVFDECCEEMLKLLRYSLSRFKNKPQYAKLEKFQNLQKD